MEADYSEEDLKKEFGEIYSVELVDSNDEKVKSFFNWIKKTPNKNKLARLKIIKEHGEKIKSVYLNFNNKDANPKDYNLDLCPKCYHSSENIYNSKEWMCWRDWATQKKKYNYLKGNIKNCEYFSQRPIRNTFYEKLQQELPLEKLRIYPSNIEWILKDLGLIESVESGWDKANKKSKDFEQCVNDDFKNLMGLTPHNRWIKVNCQHGTKLNQIDMLFTDNDNSAFLIEVKNNCFNDGQQQIKKYWMLLKKIKEFETLEFTLFLVSFHEPNSEFKNNLPWQSDYFLAQTKQAPIVNFVEGKLKYLVN